jgi:hypothetical protein
MRVAHGIARRKLETAKIAGRFQEPSKGSKSIFLHYTKLVRVPFVSDLACVRSSGNSGAYWIMAKHLHPGKHKMQSVYSDNRCSTALEA